MKQLKILNLIEEDLNNTRNKKYSNITLFNRREKQREFFSSLKNQKKTFSNFYKFQESLPHLTNTTLSSTRKNNNTFFQTDNSNKSFYLTSYNINNKYSANISFSNELEDKRKKFNFDIKLLSKFEDHVNSLKQYQNKTQIDIKNDTFFIKKEGIKSFINKTRDLKLLAYTINVKKEKSLKLTETDEQYIDEKLKSLNKTNKLFTEKFQTKFDAYVKNILIRKENEKEIKNELLKIILRLKGEISKLESKIQRYEIEKNTIIKWIYFQISVKEKKLILPIYYKILIEENDNSFKNNYEFFSRRGSLTENIMKNQKKNTRRITKKYASKQILPTNFNSNALKNLSNSEIERIKSYRKNLVFSSVEDFIEMFKKYEDNNIYKINKYNNLRNELRELIKEKTKIQKKKEDKLVIQNEIINEKINKLERIKEINKTLIKEKTKCLLEKEQNSKINESKKRTSLYNIKNTKIKSKLSDNIKKIYHTCELLNLEKILDPEIFISKRIKTKEEELLDMLNKIEYVICYLKQQFLIYRNTNGIYFTAYKLILNRIDKEHKMKIAKITKNRDMIKLKKLKEQLEKKNKKYYLLQYRKTNNYLKFAKNKGKKTYNEDDIYKEPVFEDFIYDLEEKKSHSLELKKNEIVD